MSKYRLAMDNSGLAGYWKVQRKRYLFWQTVWECSIYIDGYERAYDKCKDALTKLEGESANVSQPKEKECQ